MMIYIIYKETINFKSVPRIKPVKVSKRNFKRIIYIFTLHFCTYKCLPKKVLYINPIIGIKKIPIIKPSIEPLAAFLPPPNFFTP